MPDIPRGGTPRFLAKFAMKPSPSNLKWRGSQNVRVYHFLPEEYALSDLSQRRLKIATFDDLNDPFELLSIALPNKKLRPLFRRYQKQIAREFGMLCFSQTCKHPLLWSHYADKHKGVCLGFDVPASRLAEVSYTAERLVEDVESLLAENKRDAVRKKLLETKYKGWEYEDELRYILSLEGRKPESRNYFADFSSECLALRQVILGPRSKLKTEKIRPLILGYPNSIEIVIARLSFRRFAVVPRKDKASP